MSCGSSVRIATVCGLDGWGKRFFCTSQHPDWLWTHSASYPGNTEGPFPVWVKQLGHKADQLPPTIAMD